MEHSKSPDISNNRVQTTKAGWADEHFLLPDVSLAESEQAYTIVIRPEHKIGKGDIIIGFKTGLLVVQAHSNRSRQKGFTRIFRLPDDADKDAIHAHYADGVLIIDIPRRMDH